MARSSSLNFQGTFCMANSQRPDLHQRRKWPYTVCHFTAGASKERHELPSFRIHRMPLITVWRSAKRRPAKPLRFLWYFHIYGSHNLSESRDNFFVFDVKLHRAKTTTVGSDFNFKTRPSPSFADSGLKIGSLEGRRAGGWPRSATHLPFSLARALAEF